MGTIDTITQYILALTPAVTALVSMIVVVAVGIGQVKKAVAGSEERVERIASRHKEYQKQMEADRTVFIRQLDELAKENRELKKAFIELNKKIDIIDTIKAVERK